MKRKFHGLILLGCLTIIVISFVNFSIAKTVNGKKSEMKVHKAVLPDWMYDDARDCARFRPSCCRKGKKCVKEDKKKMCGIIQCSELECRGKKCGDLCKMPHWKISGKCYRIGKPNEKRNKCLLRHDVGFGPLDPICGKRPKICRNNAQCTRKEMCIRGTCTRIVPFGRPFVVDGEYRSSLSLIQRIDEFNAETAWNTDQVPRILANSSLNQAIAIEFSNQGEGEHASVASFARHTLQLMNMGAPTTLLIASQKAGLDEIRHAKMCYGIAKSFLGAKIQPSNFNIDGSIETMSNSEIIKSVITEGCIGETVAAVRAKLSAHYAKELNLKSILEEIAADEFNHSQLAWNTVQWAITRFPELRAIAEETFKAQLDRPINMANGLPTNYCNDCEKGSALHDHGLLLDSDKCTTENLGIQNVIEPVILNEFRNVDTISTQLLNMDFSKYQ